MSKFITAIVALACMAPSMAINAIHQFEHTPGLMAWPLAGAAVLSVLLAGCSPFAMEAAFSGRRWLALAAAMFAFVVCAAYNLSSAVGAASVARSEVSGARAADNRRAELLTGQLAQAEKSRTALAATAAEQTPEMVDKALQALRQSAIWARSKECADATLGESRTFCAEYANKLAMRDAAAKVAELDAQLAGLKTQLLVVTGATAGQPVDPQAENIGAALALVGAHAEPRKIGQGLNLWFALTIEVLGSLGPIVLAHALGRAEPARTVHPAPVTPPVEDLYAEAEDEASDDAEDGYAGLHLVSDAEAVKLDGPAPGSVEAWLLATTCDAPGAELRGSEVLKAYRKWAGEVGRAISPTKFRQELSRRLRGKIVIKTSGFVVRDLALKLGELSPQLSPEVSAEVDGEAPGNDGTQQPDKERC